ncbi:MAG: DUF4139 domain-containing protein [Bacteroidota bacterium]
MRILLVLGLLLSLTTHLLADNETEVSSSIESVTVFRQRAQISRTAKMRVSQGENLLVLSGLSQYIMPNSLTVSGTGKGTIQAVSHRVTYLNTSPRTKRMIALEDSLRVLQLRRGELADDRFVQESEQQLILDNRKLGGTEGFTPTELEQVAEIYRQRLQRIRKQLRFISREETEIQKKTSRFQQELSSITARRNQPTQEVVVAFKADQAGSVTLEVKYLVNQASWNPFYDIRVANTSSDDPLQFFLKANVVNNTGIDWQDIDVKLSTTNNNVDNTRPVLRPWYLTYSQPRYQSYQSVPAAPKMSRRDNMANTMDAGSLLLEDAEEEAISLASDFTTVSEGELGLEFDIALPYDIPADGKAHQVDVQLIDVPGEYRYYAVPKLDRDAFLVAEISQDLLRGKANVYFEGTFVGETYVNTDNPRDSMLISLGRDPKVQLQREQVKELTAVKTIGTNVRKTYAYEITLRNNKSSEVQIQIQDQLPVAQNMDVEVTAEKLSGGSYNPETGLVTWDLSLKPGETKGLRLTFEVKYPKKRPVYGL